MYPCIQRWQIMVGLACFVFGVPSIAHADEATRKRVLSEAPVGWSEIARFSRTLEVRVVDTRIVTVDGAPGSKELDHKAIHVFKTAGDNVLHSTRSDSETSKRETVDAVNDRYAFRIFREQANSPWVIQYEGNPSRINQRLKFTAQPLAISYVIDMQSLAWTFSEPGFHLIDAREISEGEKPLIEIEFRSTAKFRDDYRVHGGKVVLDPNHHWAVVRYHLDVELERKGTVAGTVAYQPIVRDGFLIPKQATCDSHYDSPETRVLRTFDFEVFEPRQFPANTFTLAAFGLSNPDTHVASRRFFWLAIFNLVGLALIAFGIVLRTRSARPNEMEQRIPGTE